MKMKAFLVAALLCYLTVSEAGFPQLIKHPDEILNEQIQYANEYNLNLQYNLRDDDNNDTIFTAPSFDNSQIRGTKMYSHVQNRTIYSYQGFRFGQAERFLPPEPVDKFWDGETFDALEFGSRCPQGGNEPSGHEDCLFLNVYSPYLPGTYTDDPDGLTVMFFIHGGAFTLGSADTYLPNRLLDQDVILVTTNYRLGAFGFYTRDSPNAPGDLAFYDQITALEWVQRHIADFGGDINKVTIFGESAGSVSVSYMMLLTGYVEGPLFRGCIAESGSAFEHWGLDEDPSYATNFYESYVGCNGTDNEDEILACMRSVPFEDFVRATHAMVSEDRRNGLIGFRGCSPTLQTFDDTDLSFRNILYQEPRDFMVNGDFRDTAYMTGSNREEGSLIVGVVYGDYLVPNDLLRNKAYLREEMLRDLLLSVGVKDEPQSLAKSLQKHYCDGVDLGNFEEAQYCLIDIGGIMFLKAGGWQMCDYHSYYSQNYNQSTFYYAFEFDTLESSRNETIFYVGIPHAGELKYIFPMEPLLLDGQQTVSDRMVLSWTNFARYLDPTPDDHTEWQDLDIPKWTPYLFEDPHFMVLDENFTVLEDFVDRWTITNDQHGPAKPEKTGKWIPK